LLKPARLQEMELDGYRGVLQQASGNQQEFEAAWGNIPKDLQADTRLLRYYLGHFADEGWYGSAAEHALQKALEREWDHGLIETYGRFRARDATTQLTRAEKWLDDYGHDEQLLLTLGRISLRARLWGKAQGYFEASIGARATPAACLELAQLLEKQLQQPEKAVKFYRQGLKLCLEDRA
jgi:HemY protein